MVEQGVMGNPLDKAKPHRAVALLMLLMAVMGEMCLAADFYGFAAVIKIVSADLALSPAQAGLVQGAFGVSFALGMLFWAPRGRSMSSVRLYLIGLGGSGFGLRRAAKVWCWASFWLPILWPLRWTLRWVCLTPWRMAGVPSFWYWAG